MSESENATFSSALAELESIVQRIDNDEIEIDRLGDELRRATELLEVCRTRIKKAELEVTQIVEKLSEGPAE
ncbi:MAG: exodeoxyribonuclease VII small subunit [Acidobacteriota bacterium]